LKTIQATKATDWQELISLNREQSTTLTMIWFFQFLASKRRWSLLNGSLTLRSKCLKRLKSELQC